MFFTLRGHSKTTWTNFCPILTTFLPIVDFRGHLVHYLPFLHVDIEKAHTPCKSEFDHKYLVYFGLPSNPINIHKQKLPGEKKIIS